jgi:ABC-type nitrate/sulfonate/bicarbonate transport system substrate-binding protein
VNAVDIGDDLTSLIDHKIDAQVAYSIDEKVAIELKGHPTVTFPAYENGFVTYSQVYYTTESFLQKNPDVVAKFLAVTNMGWREAFAHPGDTARMVVKTYMKDGDADYRAAALCHPGVGRPREHAHVDVEEELRRLQASAEPCG